MNDKTAIITNVGSVGVISDMADFLLPDEAWTSIQNMRPNGSVMETLEPDAVNTLAQSSAPTALIPVRSAAKDFIFTGSVQHAHIIEDETTAHNITRSGGFGSGTDEDVWTGGYGTVPVFNLSGFDYNPQVWDLNTSNPLVDIANWPANYKCNVIRPYREFMLAADIEDSGAHYPELLHWSDAAAPGSQPSSWDDTDSTKRSRRVDLADGAGRIVDILTIGKSAFVYKRASLWSVRFRGGTSVMQVDPVSQEIGLHDANHAVQFKRGQVFTVGQNGVLVHDTAGNSTPVLHNRMQRWLDSKIDPVNFKHGFVFTHPSYKQVFYCFPTIDGSLKSYVALVWNYQDNTLFVRDIHEDTTIGYSGTRAMGVFNWTSANFDPTYAELTESIDSMNFPIGEAAAFPYKKSIVSWASDRLHIGRSGLTEFARETRLERTGLTLGEHPGIDKHVTVVEVHAVGGPHLRVACTIGWQDKLGGPVVWDQTMAITLGVDNNMTFKTHGKICCIRFVSTGSWTLSGYDIKYTLGGAHRFSRG